MAVCPISLIILIRTIGGEVLLILSLISSVHMIFVRFLIVVALPLLFSTILRRSHRTGSGSVSILTILILIVGRVLLIRAKVSSILLPRSLVIPLLITILCSRLSLAWLPLLAIMIVGHSRPDAISLKTETSTESFGCAYGGRMTLKLIAEGPTREGRAALTKSSIRAQERS